MANLDVIQLRFSKTPFNIILVYTHGSSDLSFLFGFSDWYVLLPLYLTGRTD